MLNPGSCGGLDPINVDCYIEGDFCTQVANNAGECGEGPEPTPTPDPSVTPTPVEPICEMDSDCDDDDICTDDTCINEGFACSSVFNEANAPECAAPEGLTIVPTMGQWGMIFATIILGLFAVVRIRSQKDSEIS